METVQCTDSAAPINPLVIALVRLYSKHRGQLYLDNFQSFKLLASWLLEEEVGEWPVFDGSSVPWYHSNYEVQELAKILKCSPAALLTILEKYCE